MKDRDHKKLELIYEALNESFCFIKEEEVFAKECAKHLAKKMIGTVIKKSKDVQRQMGASMYDVFWIYVQTFHHIIPDEVMDKINLKPPISYWFDNLYEGFVVRPLAKSTTIDKLNGVCLVMKDPFNIKSPEVVPIKDEGILANKLEDALKSRIKFAFTDNETIKELKIERANGNWCGEGFVWRTNQVKLQSVENRLPELKGIF
jgi:hypothetical protein